MATILDQDSAQKHGPRIGPILAVLLLAIIGPKIGAQNWPNINTVNIGPIWANIGPIQGPQVNNLGPILLSKYRAKIVMLSGLDPGNYCDPGEPDARYQYLDDPPFTIMQRFMLKVITYQNLQSMNLFKDTMNFPSTLYAASG